MQGCAVGGREATTQCARSVKPGSYFSSAINFTPSMLAEHARQVSPSTARSMLARHVRRCSSSSLLAEHARICDVLGEMLAEQRAETPIHA
uniref:Uncharacterized protein n=1 Tax=Romanomermis culicivorax TaxID=13658 RepID=A0A915J0G9_ROMCU